jgi:hypothetical protein
MSKTKITIIAPIIAIIASNVWWAYRLLDTGVTLTCTGLSLEEHKEALNQTLPRLPSHAPFLFEKNGTLPSGVRYELQVKQGQYRPSLQLPEDDCGMWGVDCGDPNYSVESLTLKLNGKNVHFPHKFVADLGHVSFVEIKDVKGGVKILLRGGDASGSYDAEFLVRKHRLVERIVCHGEMGEELSENTVIRDDLRDHPERY